MALKALSINLSSEHFLGQRRRCWVFLVPGSCVGAALAGAEGGGGLVGGVGGGGDAVQAGIPLVLLPEFADAVGGACLELEAAMWALGVGMVGGCSWDGDSLARHGYCGV